MKTAFLLMIAIGLLIGAGGVAQLVRGGQAAREGNEAAAYRQRLAAVMLVALGLILIVFAVTFATVTGG